MKILLYNFNMDKADLHIHSIYSDGSDSIFNLIEKIKSAGINIFSLTDHDTIVGHFQLENIIPKAVRYIPGVELTCKYENFDCHILGYNYNPKDNKLLKLLEKGKILRKIKLDTRIDYLKKVWNIGLTKNNSIG